MFDVRFDLGINLRCLFCRATALVADLITGRRRACPANSKRQSLVAPLEIGRRGFAAQIAIDALIVDVKFPGDIFRVFVCRICHVLSQ
jgi:hypothetical protein